MFIFIVMALMLGGVVMLCGAASIYERAVSLVKRYGTRDTVRIAKEMGIFVHYINGLESLLGMYSYRYKERHILLNANMDHITTQMVCGHEIGHDLLHRDRAREEFGLQEFILFDIRNTMEYEANAFAAHLRIPDEELFDLLRQGYDIVEASALMETNVNLVLIKLNEFNRMGLHLDLPYIPKSDFLRQIVATPRGDATDAI